MNSNIKLAKRLIKMAKELVAWTGPVTDKTVNEAREAILTGKGRFYLDTIREWASNVAALRQAVIDYYQKELGNNVELNKIQQRIDKLQAKIASGKGNIDEILKTIDAIGEKLENAKKKTNAYKTLDESDPDSFVNKVIPEYTAEMVRSKGFWDAYKGWWDKLTNVNGMTGLRLRSIIKGFGQSIAKLAYTEDIFDHDIEVTAEMLDSIENGISSILGKVESNGENKQSIHIFLGLSKHGSNKGDAEAKTNIIKARIKKGTLMNEWVKKSTKEIRLIITDAENRIAYANQVENSMMQEILKAGEAAKETLKDFEPTGEHVRTVRQDRDLAERKGNVQRQAGIADFLKNFFVGIKNTISFLVSKTTELAKAVAGIETTELEQAVNEKSKEVEKLYDFAVEQSAALNATLREFQAVLNELDQTVRPAEENPKEGV